MNMSMMLTLTTTLLFNLWFLTVLSFDYKEDLYDFICEGDDESFRDEMIECLKKMPTMHRIAFLSCGAVYRNDTKGEFGNIIDGICEDEIYRHNVSECLNHFFHTSHNHNTSAHDRLTHEESDSAFFDHEDDHVFDVNHDDHHEMNDDVDYHQDDEEHNEGDEDFHLSKECFKSLYSKHNMSLKKDREDE